MNEINKRYWKNDPWDNAWKIGIKVISCRRDMCTTDSIYVLYAHIIKGNMCVRVCNVYFICYNMCLNIFSILFSYIFLFFFPFSYGMIDGRYIFVCINMRLFSGFFFHFSFPFNEIHCIIPRGLLFNKTKFAMIK